MRKQKVCATCSSDKIQYSAFAVWDEVCQAFDLLDFDPDEGEGPWCMECDKFVTTEDRPLE